MTVPTIEISSSGCISLLLAPTGGTLAAATRTGTSGKVATGGGGPAEPGGGWPW